MTPLYTTGDEVIINATWSREHGEIHMVKDVELIDRVFVYSFVNYDKHIAEYNLLKLIRYE